MTRNTLSFCALFGLVFSAIPAFSQGNLTVSVGSGGVATPTPLVSHGETWRFRKGTNEPASTWQTDTDASLDSSWLSGPGGFGYGDPGIVGEATTLGDMLGAYSTIYIRKSFNIASAVDTNSHLQLKIDYDDGF